MHEYFWEIKPNSKQVICSTETFKTLTQQEKCFIAFVQGDNPGKVHINNKISIFAATKTVRGKGSMLRNATYLRKVNIPTKYLNKLRAKYKNFKLTQFDQYHYSGTVTHTWLMNDLHTYSNYLWSKFKDAIFGCLLPK